MTWLLALMMVAVIGTTDAEDPMTQRIRTGADAAGIALVSGDYEAFADLVYPKVLEMLGGREGMVQMLTAGREQMRAAGADILSMKVGEVGEPVAAGAELHAVVLYQMEMQVPDGRMVQDTFLLAISGDEGETWSYLDGSGLTSENLQMVFPDFNPELELPERSEPQLLTD